MSVLTHSPDTFQLHGSSKATIAAQPAASSHVEMIKRFAKFAGALLVMALAVAAVGGIKLAFYWPHFAH